MEDKNIYTDKLTEQFIYANTSNTSDEIKDRLSIWLQELFDRRRGILDIDGLQASMVIMPEAFAGKITENDGNGPHGIANMNCLRKIDNQTPFFLDEASSDLNLCFNQTRSIAERGAEVRILVGESQAGFYMSSANGFKSKFQLNVLRQLIELLHEEKNKFFFEEIAVKLTTPTLLEPVEVDVLDGDGYEEILSALNNEEKLVHRNDLKSVGTAATAKDKQSIMGALGDSLRERIKSLTNGLRKGR